MKSLLRGSRVVIVVGLGALCVMLLAACAPGDSDDRSSPGSSTSNVADSASPRTRANGNRITWQGEEWFLLGVNMPWFNWSCDFGCNANGGVSSTKSEIGARLAVAKQAGMRNLRWWLFPGDPWQIQRDAKGAPLAIDPAVYADIDAALALASENDMYLTFTLFSAPSAIPSSWLSDPVQREGLASVLGTLFAHYNGNQRILAWDIVNEPEWDIWNGRADQDEVVAMVTSIAAEAHKNSGQLVTVGQAALDGLPMWADAGLDFHSPHWYDAMAKDDWCAICTDYASLKAKYDLDIPVVIGELYAGTDAGALNRLNELYGKGYAGAWAWSLFPEKTADKLAVDFGGVSRFADAVSEDGPMPLRKP